jgi:hypothetical protein
VKWLGLAGKIPLAMTARRRRKTFQGKKEALKPFSGTKARYKDKHRYAKRDRNFHDLNLCPTKNNILIIFR